ncbi:multidrug transporter [Kurthia zopfii]|uniref:Predicted permease, DMT superfamily n=1 Tax=Kurthia zopfii TaxID=1650 RepID=A0A8B4Q732_9BACL|nr:DMT family transporter [Kurthia zopfii]PWI22074.1 EamA family transporter [Kurthia zopfii]TDR37767.1 threonine/homoserine efflux transporter RhtA [Kurthia zopfii]GEK30866.1 multidrug transporter [Kurthia zopfii]STX08443.1 Predicted permease, DMT superfamily [Kurthia zopfii]
MNKNLIFPLLIVIASSSYGILSTIVKVAMAHGFTTAQAVQSQYAIGFLLALILFVFTQRSLPKITMKGFFIIVGAGLFTGITGIVYGKSVQYLPASLAVVMLFQFTWIGLFLDCLLHKRLPKRIELISLVFLVGGTILAAGVLDVDLSGLSWKGWAFGFAAAFSFAVFMQFNSKHVEGITTISRLTFMALVSLIIVSIFQTPEVMWNGELFTSELLYFGLALGFFGIILPILLFTVAVPKVGGGTASILSATELPVAIMASVIVLNESLSTLQIVGILVVLVGMTLPTVIEMKKEKQRLKV